MTSSDEHKPKPAIPDQKPQAPNPGQSPPSNPLDDIRNTILDDVGNFTRIKIPKVEFPGVDPPAPAKFD